MSPTCCVITFASKCLFCKDCLEYYSLQTNSLLVEKYASSSAIFCINIYIFLTLLLYDFWVTFFYTELVYFFPVK